MKRTLAVLTALMLLPSTALASSIRPGSTRPEVSVYKAKGPRCLIEEKWEKCDVTIDETGVTHPDGKIVKVVQWSTQDKDFNVGGGIVGGVAGAGIGAAAGMTSCMFLGPFCLIAAPAIMQTGMGVGGTAGGKGTGKFFTIVGDDAQGNRLIHEINYNVGKEVRIVQKQLLKTTQLANGETRL